MKEIWRDKMVRIYGVAFIVAMAAAVWFYVSLMWAGLALLLLAARLMYNSKRIKKANPGAHKPTWLAYTFYSVCLLFIVSGAFNYGFSRFLMAIPFMIGAVSLARYALQSRKLKYLALGLSGLAIIVGSTLEYNPLVFPIMHDGYVTINKDGFQQTFTDGSGSFSADDKQSFGLTAEFTPVHKGETYKVTGISISNPEFATDVNIQTTRGEFSYADYGTDENIIPNKPVYSPIFAHAGDLMMYPLVIIVLPAAIEKLFPDVPVVIEDDAGNKRAARLSRSIAGSRNVSSGDTVRLNCAKASAWNGGKLCDLEFSGFDYGGSAVRGSPDYGKYSSHSVAIDKDGVPQSEVMNYE